MRRDFIARSGLPVLFEWEALRPKGVLWLRCGPGGLSSGLTGGEGGGAPSQLPHGGGIPSPFESLCWGFWEMMADSQ